MKLGPSIILESFLTFGNFETQYSSYTLHCYSVELFAASVMRNVLELLWNSIDNIFPELSHCTTKYVHAYSQNKHGVAILRRNFSGKAQNYRLAGKGQEIRSRYCRRKKYGYSKTTVPPTKIVKRRKEKYRIL